MSEKRAKAIMVQGTMSNAGKSLIAAGLCRIFKQDGYKVAPFKSQNMALNSFITKEGLEMGRAQVVQAEAAGIEPSVKMNPVLLKPTTDCSSQVIVNGEVWDTIPGREYYKRKWELVPEIQKAYDALASEYDIIVLEGAGSPAEINFREKDMVNMFMAHMAKAPVLLVGDIDRGGVFAALYGTVKLLPEEDQAMIKGLIINKFRGDKSLLDPGVDMLTEKVNIPTLGVVPYVRLDIDEEDSLEEKMAEKIVPGLVDIVVIRLPRISNFTDFNALERTPGVTLRYVTKPGQLGDPDMIILPGTKNTMADLIWLRESGMEPLIKKHAARGKIIFGVCGGYQMLGEELRDPLGVEHGGTMHGIGLLPAVTTFEETKVRTQVQGRFAEQVDGDLNLLSGVEFDGYEIHMGQTVPLEGIEGQSLGELTQVMGRPAKLKIGLQNGNIYGSYIHGIFDREDVTRAVILALYRKKGLDMNGNLFMDRKVYKETQYDLLAKTLREHLNMDEIYRILEEGA